MNKMRFVRLSLSVFFTGMLLAITVQVHAQLPVPTTTVTPAPSTQPPGPAVTRDNFIAEIRGYAERHVKNNGPMQTPLVVELFRDNPVGLAQREIALIYEEEYTKQRHAQKPGLWEQLLPNFGWIAAIILLLVAVFRNVVSKWLVALVEAISNWFYQRLAGSPFLRGVALRKYRKALAKKYHLLPITFRPERPLNMREVYVPLQVVGQNDSAQLDAYLALAKSSRIMVIGLPDRPIPILLELHRLNGPKFSVEEHLVAGRRIWKRPKSMRRPSPNAIASLEYCCLFSASSRSVVSRRYCSTAQMLPDHNSTYGILAATQ